jgi:hypothetical protein
MFITVQLKNCPKNRILAKYSIPQAPTKGLFPHRLIMIVREKTRNAFGISMKTRWMKNNLEKRSKKSLRKASRSKTQCAILLHNFRRKVILKVCITSFRTPSTNNRILLSKKYFPVTARDPGVSNYTVNAFKSSYFAIKTAIVTVVVTKPKTSWNINKQS